MNLIRTKDSSILELIQAFLQRSCYLLDNIQKHDSSYFVPILDALFKPNYDFVDELIIDKLMEENIFGKLFTHSLSSDFFQKFLPSLSKICESNQKLTPNNYISILYQLLRFDLPLDKVADIFKFLSDEMFYQIIDAILKNSEKPENQKVLSFLKSMCPDFDNNPKSTIFEFFRKTFPKQTSTAKSKIITSVEEGNSFLPFIQENEKKGPIPIHSLNLKVTSQEPFEDNYKYLKNIPFYTNKKAPIWKELREELTVERLENILTSSNLDFLWPILLESFQKIDQDCFQCLLRYF
jgi:hypothetical protein